jgi:SAM-dependent methyltransferase
MSLKTRKNILKFALLDIPDFFYRLATNQMYLPPYSLRTFVGGAKGFDTIGTGFLNDFRNSELINQNTKKILDIGCGSGRLAYPLAKEEGIKEQGIKYVGMDIDTRCIEWCKKNIHPINPNFDFFEADIKSTTYNPTGKYTDEEYQFPFEDNSFDLIILTSVFTHMLEKGITNYCNEIHRLLTRNGTAYITAFVYKTKDEAINGVERRKYKFPYYYDNYAVVNALFPEYTVAYQEDYLLNIFKNKNLTFRMEPRYGGQDIFFLMQK